MRPVSAAAWGDSWLELQKLTQEHFSIFVHLGKVAGPFTHRNLRIKKMAYPKGDGEDYFGGARVLARDGWPGGRTHGVV